MMNNYKEILNMKRKLIWPAIVLLAVLTIAACGDAHQHTYSDVWQMDENSHWLSAVCNNGDDCSVAKGALSAHTDSNNDKLCDVCGYDYDHEHTYATEWTSDENGHSYTPTCGCTVEGKDKASHIDSDNDGACDICAYNGGHTHEYIMDAWAADDSAHWHPAKCGHTSSDKEDHELDEMDRCVTCGYVKGGINVEKAVNIGEYYDNLVNGGKITFVDDTYRKHTTVIDFKLGAAMSQYESSNSDGVKINTYYAMTQGGLFAVEEDLTDPNAPLIYKPYNPSSSFVDGYGFSEVFAVDDEDTDTFYGAADLVTGLYELAKKNGTHKEYVIYYNDSPVYIFTLSSEVYNESYLYDVTVMFTIGEGGNYDKIQVKSERYTVERAEGADSAYDKVNIFPIAAFSYNIEQTVGKRELAPKYTSSSLLATDFELNDESGNKIDGTINASAGQFLSFFVKPTAPSTASISFDTITVSGEGLNISTWDENGNIYFTAPAAGTYTFTVKTANSEEKKYTLVVTSPEVNSIWATVKNESNVFEDRDDHVVSLGADGTVSVIISAEVNSYADPAYTAALPDIALGATLTDNGDGTYLLKATTPGEWTITITSKANKNITSTLKITVKASETDDGGVLAGHKYYITDGSSYTYFTFGTDGNLTIENSSLNGLVMGYNGGKYPYTQSGTLVTVTTEETFIIRHAQGGSGFVFVWAEKLGPNTMYLLTPTDGTIESKPLTEVEKAIASGSWDYMIDGERIGYTITFGSGAYLVDNVVGSYPDFRYTVDGNNINITWPDSYKGALKDATFVYSPGKKNITATLKNGTEIVFAKSREYEGGGR